MDNLEFDKEKLVNDIFINQPEHFDYVKRELHYRLTMRYAYETAMGFSEAWDKAMKGDLREIYVMLDDFDQAEIDNMCSKLPDHVSVELRKGWNALRQEYYDDTPDREYECRDCQSKEIETPHLKDEVWFKFAKEDDLLCLSCTEKHMGREISYQDFNNERT